MTLDDLNSRHLIKVNMFRFVLLTFLIINMNSSFGVITPVNIIYRYDTRPPEEIIQAGGFMPWRTTTNGGDNDLVSHVEGTSVWTRTTAFVSASERIEGAMRTVGQAASGPHHVYPENYHSYLYAIRPDPVNTFQVSGSLSNAMSFSQSAITRRLYRTLDEQMNMGIYEAVTLNGLSSDRIIAYADITGELLRTNALASMFAPSFWSMRWTSLSTYDSRFDHDVSAVLPYPPSSMREPDGRGFFVQNIDLEDEVLPASMCCFGIIQSFTFNSIQNCNTRLKVRYLPYLVTWVFLFLRSY